MDIRCQNCGKMVPDTAKFCKHCGSDITASPLARVSLGANAVGAKMQFCENCRSQMPADAKFCNKCGKQVGTPVEVAVAPAPPRPRQIPQRQIERPAREPGERSVSSLPIGNKVAGIGGLVALAGCFLPLASGLGSQGSNIIPSAVNEVPQMLVVPLCAVALAVMSWSASAGTIKSKIMLGGGVIGISSPFAVVLILIILGANQIMSGLGPLGGLGGIGVGAFALALGFAAGVVGGFMVLHENTRQ